MAANVETRTARCHCGEVQFSATLRDGFKSIRRCNCSYCRMRGAVVVAVEADAIQLIQGEDSLASYRFNTGVAQHFFCSQCGVSTHFQRRSDPTLYGINVACLDGVSPFDFLDVPVMDGANHPSDTGGPAHRFGVLHFTPAKSPR